MTLDHDLGSLPLDHQQVAQTRVSKGLAVINMARYCLFYSQEHTPCAGALFGRVPVRHEAEQRRLSDQGFQFLGRRAWQASPFLRHVDLQGHPRHFQHRLRQRVAAPSLQPDQHVG